MFLDEELVIHRNHIEACIVIVCVRFDQDAIWNHFESKEEKLSENKQSIKNWQNWTRTTLQKQILNFHATYMIEIRPDWNPFTAVVLTHVCQFLTLNSKRNSCIKKSIRCKITSLLQSWDFFPSVLQKWEKEAYTKQLYQRYHNTVILSVQQQKKWSFLT